MKRPIPYPARAIKVFEEKMCSKKWAEKTDFRPYQHSQQEHIEPCPSFSPYGQSWTKGWLYEFSEPLLFFLSFSSFPLSKIRDRLIVKVMVEEERRRKGEKHFLWCSEEKKTISSRLWSKFTFLPLQGFQGALDHTHTINSKKKN